MTTDTLRTPAGTSAPGGSPDAKIPRPRLVVGMAASQLGLFLALLTPILVSLQLKVQSFVPEDDQVASLGIITTTGSVAAMLANPFFGRLSDRTTSRFGRRRPWLVLGMLGLLAGLLIIATANSVAVVTVGFVISSASANAALAAFVATVADNVPEHKRGKISGCSASCRTWPPRRAPGSRSASPTRCCCSSWSPASSASCWWSAT
ncbi:MFS transporter [Streptomyces sp. NBC_00102]|uniref:MFS transporter n=1 Tax=Streptomyces sp. NBC_00102 TaxID=2975652 RepID=UPI002257C040|nr:MFS transporter [Streptomyces sp. NBC_00102]MCX5399528.1 MFS transporter [Streptomyces sp. NBC_00102]